MQGKWKRRLIVCLKLLTKLLIILVSCGMTFIGLLIMLLPLAPIIMITGGRGHMHSHGEVECIFRFSKTLIYTFIGWLEGVLICLAGYAKHVVKAIKARDGKMMKPAEFWKVYTSREEFINREKWVTEKNPDKHVQVFLAWCRKSLKALCDCLKSVRTELEKTTMQELLGKCKASVEKRCETLIQSLRANGKEMNENAESGEVAMLAGTALGTALIGITGAAGVFVRSAGIGVGCTLFLVKYLICYVHYIVMTLWKREERPKNPVVFWWECYRERNLINRKRMHSKAT